MQFSQDMITQFRHYVFNEPVRKFSLENGKKDPLRLGQHFYNFFKLEKVTNPNEKIIVDEIYELDNDKFWRKLDTLTMKEEAVC